MRMFDLINEDELVFYSASDRMLKGLPDICGGVWRGRPFVIEMKSVDGEVSKTQRDWLHRYARAGAFSIVLWAWPDGPKPLRARYTPMQKNGLFGPPVDCAPGWLEQGLNTLKTRA